MSDTDFESELAAAIESEYGTDGDVATDAAAKAAAFREDHAADLAADDVLDELAESPYEAFEHRFDAAIGELAAAAEDCTDSRPYRLAGFDDHAADPSIGG